MTDRTDAELRSEIDRTRTAMADTVGQLGERLDPKVRAREQARRIRAHARRGDELVPAAAAGAAMLIAVLVMGVKRSHGA